MTPSFTESIVDDSTLAQLSALGYSVAHAPDLAYGTARAERTDPAFRDVTLDGRLRSALTRLNSNLPPDAIDDAYRKLTRADAPSLVERNRAIHRLLVDGVPVEYRRPDGSIAGAQARVIDFEKETNNDWLALNQLTVADEQHKCRPDIVLFLNGLPLAVVELKNAADEEAMVWSAYQQLQTYQAQVPALFAFNAALIASDGVQARIGALGAGKEWFKPWRTISGSADADTRLTELPVMPQGVFEPRRFLDLLRYFIVFEDSGGGSLIKKLAGYHQFHAVNVAVEETLRAAQLHRIVSGPEGRYESRGQPGGEPGDRRVGVVNGVRPPRATAGAASTTMRVAALYDIHGNLPALEAVLDELDREHVDLVVVGGDVLPGPMPCETLDRLRQLSLPTLFIAGNGEREELTIRGGETVASIPAQYIPSMEWIARQLTPVHAQWITSWPATVTVNIPGLDDVLFCHATPRSDNECFTRLTPDEHLLPIFGSLPERVFVCGHTHMQFDRHMGGTRLINAGSVGMPFGSQGANWLLLGPDVQLRHTMYDLDAAAARIRLSRDPHAEYFASNNVLHPPSEKQMLEMFTQVEQQQR